MEEAACCSSGSGLTSSEADCVDRVVNEFLGSNRKIVSIDKKVVVKEHEVIMVNGTPIVLEGQEGEEIKNCLLRGSIPTQDLLNHLLLKAGLLIAPKRQFIQADAAVSSTVCTAENAILYHQNGQILDQKSSQSSHVHTVQSHDNHLWEPPPRSSTPVAIDTDQAVEGHDEPDFSTGVFAKRSTPSQLKRLSGLMYDQDGSVSSGTLEELIHELVPRAHASPSEAFQFAFLLMSRLFLTPTRLMAEVYRRVDQLVFMLSSESHPSFVQNLVTMLSRWMVWFPMDFREESMQQKTRHLVQLAVDQHPSVEIRLSQLLQTLMTHLAAMDKHERGLERKLMPCKEAPEPDLLQINVSAAVFAQELTRIELEYLCFLGPEELVNAFAQQCSSLMAVDKMENAEMMEARRRAAQKTKNMEAYIAWFNHLSFLVASTVCTKRKKKTRVKVIEYWIEVARECINLGNFNSLMGIITGLNMTPISRLRRTWTKIQSGKFAALEHQMDPSSNFLSYRSTLRAAVSRSEGATDQRQRVVIPFFSLLVKDLYFVNEGCATKLPNGHINFTKAKQLAEKLREFAKWKDVECPYVKVHMLTNFIYSYPILSEQALDLESYECEHPEMSEEKERRKLLKHKLRLVS